MESSNGADPAAAFDAYVTEARGRLDSEVATMRAMLEDERALEQRLAEQAEAARNRRRRLEKVVEILSGEQPKAKPMTPGPGAWRVSDQKLGRVWDLMRQQTEPFTVGGLAAVTPGLSAGTARRAADVFRERELLRVVGRGRGGGTLFAVMPGASELDHHGA